MHCHFPGPSRSGRIIIVVPFLLEAERPRFLSLNQKIWKKAQQLSVFLLLGGQRGKGFFGESFFSETLLRWIFVGEKIFGAKMCWRKACWCKDARRTSVLCFLRLVLFLLRKMVRNVCENACASLVKNVSVKAYLVLFLLKETLGEKIR